MRAFVVMAGSYEDVYPVAVGSTLAQAEALVAAYNAKLPTHRNLRTGEPYQIDTAWVAADFEIDERAPGAAAIREPFLPGPDGCQCSDCAGLRAEWRAARDARADTVPTDSEGPE